MKAYAVQKKCSASAKRHTSTSSVCSLGPTRQAKLVEIRPILPTPQAQSTLRIGTSNDIYEQQADRVAEQIVGSPNFELPSVDVQSNSGVRLQRVFAADSAEVGADLNLNQNGGHPLSASTRDYMEPRFGADFSHVRLHTDPRAQRTASQFQARAFTYGNNIWLGKAESEGNKSLMAHELTHVVQQTASPAEATIQMQAAAPAAATYARCSSNQSARIENSRKQARNFVQVTINRLNKAPTAGTTYATASNRHFISPAAAQRATIGTTFGRITAELARRSNFICDPTSAVCTGGVQAFWAPADDLVHICDRFWDFGPTCRSIILIHEAAHDIGIDDAPGAHQPNRGSAAYPAGNVAPPAGQTTVGRMNFPDAYAFFAHHVWNDADTTSTCF